MKKLSIKLLSIVFSMCLLFSQTITTVAASRQTPDKEKIVYEDASKFKQMSIDELNEYIDNIVQGCKHNDEVVKTKSLMSYNPVKEAWLAAAQVARLKGFPCAATLVEFSVKNYPYKEDISGGLIQDKIIETDLFKDYVEDIRSGARIKSLEFKLGDDRDLFYALHMVNVESNKLGMGIIVNMTDTFDFKQESYEDSTFATFINNWAWLCQNADVLNPIDVEISILV